MLNWQNIVKTVAPVIGTALGGPLGGAATKFLTDKFLGDANASEEALAQAITTADPDQLVKLKELDQQFALELKRLDVDVYNIDAQDRASARDREKSIKDLTPSLLAFFLALGFFFTIFKLLSDGAISESDQIVLTIMSNLFTMVLSYYYGSSNKDKK